MAQSGYDTLAKVVLIGESGVGKSSLVHRFLSGNWLENTTPTIGIDFHVRDVPCNGKTVKLQIWDTGMFVVCLFILLVCLLFVCLFYLFVCLFILLVCLFVYLLVCLFVYLLVCLFICLFVCLFIYFNYPA